MKTLLAIAALGMFGSFAAVAAHAEDGAEKWGLRTAAPADAASRVKMAFSVHRDAAAPEKVRLRGEAPVAETVAPTPVRAEASVSTTPWYGRDASLQRGDIVVTEAGALVYEGEKGGKRHFRSLNMSRLVSAEERQIIAASARR